MTLTNAVRGGSPPFDASTPRAPLDAPDPNYLRCLYYRDELQAWIENDPDVSERVRAKWETMCWVVEGWR